MKFALGLSVWPQEEKTPPLRGSVEAQVVSLPCVLIQKGRTAF